MNPHITATVLRQRTHLRNLNEWLYYPTYTKTTNKNNPKTLPYKTKITIRNKSTPNGCHFCYNTQIATKNVNFTT